MRGVATLLRQGNPGRRANLTRRDGSDVAHSGDRVEHAIVCWKLLRMAPSQAKATSMTAGPHAVLGQWRGGIGQFMTQLSGKIFRRGWGAAQRLARDKGLPLPVLARILGAIEKQNLSHAEATTRLEQMAESWASFQSALQQPAPAEYEPARQKALTLLEQGALDSLHQQLRAAQVTVDDWAAEHERRVPKLDVPCPPALPPASSLRARIERHASWLNVVIAMAAAAIAALALVPAFASMYEKDESKPTQVVDARFATTPVTLGPGAKVGSIQVGNPGISRADLEQLNAGQAKLLRAIAADKGVPVPPLMVVLQKLGEHDVPVEDIPRRLAAKADEFVALRTQLQSVSFPEVESVRREALERLEKGDLDDARVLLQKAREQLRTQSERFAKAQAALLADEATIDGLELRYLAAADKYEACAKLVHFDRDANVGYLERQAGRLYDQGNELGDNNALERAAAVYGELLRRRPHERVPLDWAGTQNNLGNALWALGGRESGTARLEQAVHAYEQALVEWTRQRVPLQWAMTQNNLGVALQSLGERESGTARLQQAVRAFEQALMERTRERVPLQWATTQNNLGNALWALGERESGTAHLQQAVHAYEQALLERTREQVPLQWAMTQNNLGTALQTLGERQSDTTRLQQAVHAYEQALVEWTRERVPLQWATTQNNLGTALQTLGERESDSVRLQQAVHAFELALLEYARERVPLQWAMTQNNLGTALRALGERESDTTRLQQAVRTFERALVEYTRERVPLDWAETQNNLGLALKALGERESGTARLRRAVHAFEVALMERTREHAPLQWAETQNNLGLALRALGERESGTVQLQRAAVAHRNAISVWQRSEVPAEWAHRAQDRLAELDTLIAHRR